LQSTLGCSVAQLQKCIALMGQSDFSAAIFFSKKPNKNSVLSWLLATQSDLAKMDAERNQAICELRKYQDHLQELVESRTYELEEAKNAANAANVAKGNFIARMSHELRTPLNAILGFSELLSKDENLNTSQKYTLDVINRNGIRLLCMINDVLDMSKIEVGRQELTMQTVNLHKQLHEIADIIRQQLGNKNLSFRVEIAPDMPQYIQTDNAKLRQVLLNLLNNAIKFTEEGAIILRANYRVLPIVSKIMLSIEVLDSGAGIPENKLNTLFLPFVQLEQANTETKGSGLGLAISKSLVELMAVF
jgi:signal transduction histidine kinase